jgi:hypothetical protein
VNDDLVAAIDEIRSNRGSRLHNIIGRMIVVRGITLPDDVNEVRSYVYENIAALIHRGTVSIEIARQLRTIIARRISDLYRKKTRVASLAGHQVVSLEEVIENGEDVGGSVSAEEAYLTHENIRVFERLLNEMRHSGSAHDRRDCLVLEAHLDEIPVSQRMLKVLGKAVTSEHAATLLYRAKQRLKKHLISKGIRGEEL